jgi:MoaA/NifB/PqqE/SkfB family radical SAM enzyme
MSVRPIYKHDHLSPTKRGWLFLGNHGGPCDRACRMCYYAFQRDLTFFSLDTLIAHANKFRHLYGLEYCDISGGEATILGKKVDGRRPDLETLVRHCADIGLKPTIITHGQNNTAELVKGVEDAGLEDWLISMHGLVSGHDATVVDHRGQGEGGWERLVAGLQYCQRPVRFNTTLQNFNYQEVPALARWLVDNRPATVWNLIQFNPFFKWTERPEIDFQEKSTTLAPYVAQAIEIAEAAGWEVNCRYFAPCIAQEYGFAKNCVGFFQTQIDPWEWALVATERAPMEWVKEQGGIHQANMAICRQISDGRANAKCVTCRFFKTVCEGIPEQYQQRYGIDELVPSIGTNVNDPAYFERGGQF